MSVHTCHALGCKRRCPPAHLMCGQCWAQVPPAIQREVYATVGLRAKVCDATWAPWWRAQARAVAHVAHLHEPNAARRDAYIARADAFAATLEERGAR